MSTPSLQERVISVPKPQWAHDALHPYFRPGAFPNVEQRLRLECNPRPCVPHPREVVEAVLAHAEATFPLPHPPRVYLPAFDSLAGGNQAATYWELRWDWPKDNEERTKRPPFIILFGKPTPLHPAVTRYLVGHEYGHAVADVLAHMHTTVEDPRPSFLRHYAEVRGLKVPEEYDTDTWDAHPEEVCANDFRILMLGCEDEFWPHPHVPRPESIPHLMKWWLARAEEMKERMRRLEGVEERYR